MDPAAGEPATADDDGGALAAVLAIADALEAAPHNALLWWGIEPRLGQAEADKVVTRRLAEARAAADAESAARSLFGGDAVVTGAVTLTTAAPWTVDQTALGVSRGELTGWIQDTARVRDAARGLDEALLHGDLRGVGEVAVTAGQTPATGRWVGQAFGGTLGRDPVVSFVALHDDQVPATGPLVGIELDAWVEVVPEKGGAGAIAANLASPDSRAPNTVLLAVPSDVQAPWTQESLFSVVDEAIELAECRLVDLDASRRVPGVLPAIYVSEYDDDVKWRDLLHQRVDFPMRYVTKGAL